MVTNYEIQTGLFAGLGLGATLVSVGKRQFKEGDTLIYYDGYERVDFSLSYSGISNIDLSLQIRNVFDKAYIERATNRGTSFYGSPTAALLQVKYHF